MGEIKLKSGQGRQGFGGRVQLERRSGTKGLTGLEERRKWSLEGIIIETVHCLQYYIRQTDISRPLHRADDSCAHVEVRCRLHEPQTACLAPTSSARQASARRSLCGFMSCVSSQPCGLAQHSRQDPSTASSTRARAGQTTTACNQTTQRPTSPHSPPIP
jgi:hypothetical protein